MQHSITLLGLIALTQPGSALGHCPVEKQMIVPLSPNQMGWRITAECCVAILVTSNAPPHHNTSSSMLHGGKYTWRSPTSRLTKTRRLEPKISHLDSTPKDKFPPVQISISPLLMFIGPSKSLLIIGVL